MKRIIISCMAVFAVLLVAAQQTPASHYFKTDYLLYLPDGYSTDTTKLVPLVVFLHGSGERGTEVEKVAVHGIPKHLKNGEPMPFIAVSPQCPTGYSWDVKILNSLLDEIMAKYRVDPDRVYLTGLSMGGYGTWEWARVSPERFAAIVPICGGGKPEAAWRMRNIPTWVFHGAKDMVVPMSASVDMVKALEEIGSDPKFTVYPDAYHESWTPAYCEPKLYEWLLSQKRQAKVGKALSAKDGERYIGNYIVGRDTVKVSTIDGKLMMSGTGSFQQEPIEIICDGKNRFYVGNWWDCMIRFLEADDCIYGVEIHGRRTPAIGTKL